MQRIGSFDDMPEKRTAQEELLKQLDEELTIIHDDLNFPITIGTCEEQLRMAPSLLELWRIASSSSTASRSRRSPTASFERSRCSSTGRRPPSHTQHRAPAAPHDLRTPTRPASSRTSSRPPPSAAGRSSTCSSSPSRGASPKPSRFSTRRWKSTSTQPQAATSPLRRTPRVVLLPGVTPIAPQTRPLLLTIKSTSKNIVSTSTWLAALIAIRSLV